MWIFNSNGLITLATFNSGFGFLWTNNGLSKALTMNDLNDSQLPSLSPPPMKLTSLGWRKAWRFKTFQPAAGHVDSYQHSKYHLLPKGWHIMDEYGRMMQNFNIIFVVGCCCCYCCWCCYYPIVSFCDRQLNLATQVRAQHFHPNTV